MLVFQLAAGDNGPLDLLLTLGKIPGAGFVFLGQLGVYALLLFQFLRKGLKLLGKLFFLRFLFFQRLGMVGIQLLDALEDVLPLEAAESGFSEFLAVFHKGLPFVRLS